MKNKQITINKLLNELKKIYGCDINISLSVPIVFDEVLAKRLNSHPSCILLKGYLSTYQSNPNLLDNLIKCKDIQIVISLKNDENFKILKILHKKLDLFERLSDGTRIIDNLYPKNNITAPHPSIIFDNNKTGLLFLSKEEVIPLSCDEKFKNLDINKLFSNNSVVVE